MLNVWMGLYLCLNVLIVSSQFAVLEIEEVVGCTTLKQKPCRNSDDGTYESHLNQSTLFRFYPE